MPRKKRSHGKHISIELCPECNNNMRIELDLNLNGNHVIECPHCGHEHCRVIENGKITGVRWDVRPGGQGFRSIFQSTTAVYYTTGTAVDYATDSSTSCSSFLTDSWTSGYNTTGGWDSG